jgi:hypothetical protein
VAVQTDQGGLSQGMEMQVEPDYSAAEAGSFLASRSLSTSTAKTVIW